MGEGQDDPRLFKGWNQTSESLIWRYKGPKCDKYQYEHDLLFDAIRNDKPYNEAERCAKTSLTCIMGRMACESGKKITWEEALASNIELAPGLDYNCTGHGMASTQCRARRQAPVSRKECRLDARTGLARTPVIRCPSPCHVTLGAERGNFWRDARSPAGRCVWPA
jgi:hypothetical protein